MNQITKYIGMLAILSVAWSMAISSDYIGTAEAAGSTAKVHPTGSAQDFQSYQGEPFVELVSVVELSAKSPDKSIATIKAYAGGFNIIDVQILVTSDIDSETASINGIQALSSSVTNVLLKVNDPNSVTTEILNYQIKD